MGPLEIRANKNEFRPGDNLEIRCLLPNVRSQDQNMKFSWSKMNGDILSDTSITQYQNGSVLRIDNLQYSNRGVYRCNVVTRYSTIYVDYTVDVKGYY